MEQKESSDTTAGNGVELFITQNILGQTTVTFSMSSHGWLKLEKSEAWKEICEYLEEFQTQEIHWLHQENLFPLEKEYCKNPLSQLVHSSHVCLKKLWLAIWNRGKEHH